MLTLPFITIVLLTFVTVVALPCNVLAWCLLATLARTRPQTRTPLLLLLVAAPWLLGGGVLISSVVDIFFGACDAGNVCLWSENLYNTGWRVAIIVPLVAGMGLTALALSRQLARSRIAIRALACSSDADPATGAWMLASDVPLALAARGRVFISRGLRAGLSARQLQAVLLHERAHLQRSDGVCAVLAHALSCSLLPPLQRRVLDALALSNEQACDEAAATVVGRLQTAQAILAAERLCAVRGPIGGVLHPAFAHDFVADRVQRLMAPPPAGWSGIRSYAAAMCVALTVFMLGDLLYYTGMWVLNPGSVAFASN